MIKNDRYYPIVFLLPAFSLHNNIIKYNINASYKNKRGTHVK